jgi:hypothetical protein
MRPFRGRLSSESGDQFIADVVGQIHYEAEPFQSWSGSFAMPTRPEIPIEEGDPCRLDLEDDTSLIVRIKRVSGDLSTGSEVVYFQSSGPPLN